MAHQLFRVGFSSTSVFECLETDFRLADKVDARMMVVSDGENTAVLATFDFLFLSQAMNTKLKQAIADAINIPAACVGVFATQNHSVWLGDAKDPETPTNVFLREDKILAAAGRGAKAALADLQEAEMGFFSVKPESPLCFGRRAKLDGFGAFTIWFGCKNPDFEHPDCSHVIKSALTSLANGTLYQKRFYAPTEGIEFASDVPEAPIPVPSPFYLPPAVDPLLQGMFFRTVKDKKPIGSLTRLAAHPDPSYVYGSDYHSGDYPAYLRDKLEKEFGGKALFLTGPCGDQTLGYGPNGIEVARLYGERIADNVLAALPAVTWQGDCRVAACSPLVNLQIRKDYPESKAEAREKKEQLEERFARAVADKQPLTELKRISDQWEKLECALRVYYDGGKKVDITGKAGQEFPMTFFALGIGDKAIAGIPGDSMAGISKAIRDSTLGENLIMAEGVFGCFWYIPSKAEHHLGGYESNSAIFSDESEQRIVAGLKKGLEELGL